MSHKRTEDRKNPAFPWTARQKRQSKDIRKSRKQLRHRGVR